MFNNTNYKKALKKSYEVYNKNNMPPPQITSAKIDDILKRVKRNAKILDASGGSLAKTTIYLAENDYDVYYSEVVKDYVNYAKYVLKNINQKYTKPKNRCCVSFFPKLYKKYKTNFFDGIISIMTLNLGNWKTINENWTGLTKILKKGGYIQLVFHKYNPKNTLLTLDSPKIPSCLDKNHEHNKNSFDFRKVNHPWRKNIFHMYTKEEIKELCKKNNLKIIKLEPILMFWKQSPYWYLLAQKV